MEFRTRICQSENEGVHCFPAPLGNTDTETARPLVAGFATKFEPNLARTFLPGWDEPRFRSTFNVSIRHFADARVLTNSAAIPSASTNKEQPLGTSLIRTSKFATTPPMPLYLLAFASGPFTPLEVRTTRGNISLNVWTAPQDMLLANFVANFSPTMFDRLHEDFGVILFVLLIHHFFLGPLSTAKNGYFLDTKISGWRHGKLGPDCVAC